MTLSSVQIEAEMRCDCGKSPHDKTCAYYFTPMKNTDWEEQFDKEIHEKVWGYFPANEIKDFIRSLLTSQRAELVGKIEKELIEPHQFGIACSEDELSCRERTSEEQGHNWTVNRILALLQDTNTTN